jgi:hypothetical protein
VKDKQQRINANAIKQIKENLGMTDEQKKRSLNTAQQTKLIEFRVSEKESTENHESQTHQISQKS